MRTCGIAMGLMMTMCGWVHADPLADAQKLWDQKQFGAAYAAFSPLAAGGNAAAQLQLGEMIGFGEGTAEDAALAATWLAKAQAAGHPEAAASLALVRERAARKADIARYTRAFDGAALSYEHYRCARPAIPALSTKNDEIVAINAGINNWTACYGRFAAALNAALPATNTIPPDILKLMNQAEFSEADAAIGRAYTKIAADAQKIADQLARDNLAWKTATEDYVRKNNAKTADALVKTENEYELIRREAEQEKARRRSYAQDSKKN